MRTNYPLDKIVRRRNDERRRLVIALATIFILVFLLMARPVRSGLTKLTIMVTKPLWVIENNTLVLGGDLFRFLRSHKGLVEDNRHLQEEVFKLKAELSTKDLLTKEYERLSLIVGRSTEKGVPILAKAIIKPSRTPYDLIVVDVGSASARPVKVGNIARLSPDITIGKVVNVVGDLATIELFSSPGLATAVLVGPNNIQATIVGRGGGNMLLELPRGSVVQAREAVTLLTSRTEVIGLIGEVINDSAEPTQKIAVTLPVNLFEISWVEIYDR